jgi:hypothetical protein
MEVAQHGGQAAHVVGVSVGEGDHIEAANAARPQNLRDDLLADVIVLRRLMRAAAKAAAIDEQGFAVGRNQQQGIALAYVDGLHQQCVARMIDRTGRNGSQSSADQEAAHAARRGQRSRRNGQAGQHDGRRKQHAEGERLTKQRRGNAEVAPGH